MSAVKHNIIANYLGQAWAGVMALSFLPVYIDYLGIEAYGLIGLFAVMQTLLILLDMGMTPTINREMALFSAGQHSPQSIRTLLRTLETICFSIALMIALGVWAASGYISAEWLNIDGLTIETVSTALLLMGIVVAFRFCEALYRGALYGLEKQVWYNVAYAVITTLRYAGALLVLGLVSNSIEAFFFWQGFVSLCAILVFSTSVHNTIPAAPVTTLFSFAAVSGIWKFSAGMLGITVLTALLLHTDKVLLSRMLPLKDFAYYSLAATAAGILFMIVVPVTQAVFPKLVSLMSQGKVDELSGIYHLMTEMVSVATAPAAIILCCFAGGVVYMWSGNSLLAEQTAPLLSIIVVGYFLNGLAHIPYQVQIAKGWTSLLLRVNTLVVTGLTLALFFFVPKYGAMSAAWIWTLANVFYLLVSVHFMHRRLLPKEKWRWVFSGMILPTSGALAVMLLALQFRPSEGEGRVYWLLFLLGAWSLSTLTSLVLASSLRQRVISIVWKIPVGEN